jgi:hypothetical protein
MPTFHAFKSSHLGHFYFTSFNAKGKTFDQRPSYLMSRRFNNPSESLP